VIRSHQHRWLGLATLLLYLLVIVSLVGNGLLIWRLLELRARAYALLADLLVLTQAIEEDTIAIPVEIDQAFPVRASVPFQYQATIPIDTDVPISTTVAVPVQLLGRVVEFEVPIHVTVPISYQAPISVEKTIEVSTTVPVHLETTVELRLSETPVGEVMQQLRQAIQRLLPEDTNPEERP
jgi:hypothetical protein